MKPVSVCQHCGVIIRKTARGWRHIKATGCADPAPGSPRQSNPVSETKAERAAKMYSFIVQQATAGKTVYLQTALRTTAIKKKHLPQVRILNGSLEIQSGKRWLDYTWVDKVSAS